MRLTSKQNNALKKRYGVDRLWSYSRLNTFIEHPWEYRLTYLEKRVRTSNVYTHFGTIAHDCIQDFYDGKYPKEKMIDVFEDHLLKWRTGDQNYTFASEKIEEGYVENLRNYFKTTEIVPFDIVNERPVRVVLNDGEDNNIVFIGYLDSEYINEKGEFVIVDYKTSSLSGFSGKSLSEKAKQLKLYAIGIHQARKIPYDKIRLRFDMMKYVSVSFLQKNGKWKTANKERIKWVEAQEKRLRKALFDLEYEMEQIDDLVEQAILMNTLEYMPEEIQKLFKIQNCYIDVKISQEEAEELQGYLVEKVKECLACEASDNWDEAFPEPVIDAGNSFYYTQLAPQLMQYHSQQKEEQEDVDAFLETLFV